MKLRVRVYNVNTKIEYFGWTDNLPYERCSFFMTKDDGTFFSTREVLEVFDKQDTSIKFITRCGSYFLQILNKPEERVIL